MLLGNASYNAIDNPKGDKKKFNTVLKFPKTGDLSVDDAIDLLYRILPPEQAKLIKDNYSFGFRSPPPESPFPGAINDFLNNGETRKYNDNPKYWSNPL